MDYTTAPFIFRLRKGLRYVRLYGVGLTAAKVRALYHMKRRFEPLPEIKASDSEESKKHVAVVGCGRFGFGSIAHYLKKTQGNVIRAAMDTDIHRAASLFKAYKADYYTDDFSAILEDEQIDLIFIASNHASHAEYAVQALQREKSVHIEKPHVVNLDQLHRLRDAMQGARSAKVRLGFNRPSGRIGRFISEAVAQEDGPVVVNWFIAGHALDEDHWYYAPEEGGRVLGNLTHWIDFTFRLIEPGCRYPIQIQATRGSDAKKDFIVSYAFGDGSLATISFSAKGHTFEGVMERLAVHKGSLLVTMDDFQTLTAQRGHKKTRIRLRHRDHGHRAATERSYDLAGTQSRQIADDVEYVYEVGLLTLRTREAVESGRLIAIDSPDLVMT